MDADSRLCSETEICGPGHLNLFNEITGLSLNKIYDNLRFIDLTGSPENLTEVAEVLFKLTSATTSPGNFSKVLCVLLDDTLFPGKTPGLGRVFDLEGGRLWTVRY